MKDCELTKDCIFFNDKMANMPAMVDRFKKNYCKHRFEDCARFVVYKTLGREHVPSTLFPNHKGTALDILHSAEESTQ